MAGISDDVENLRVNRDDFMMALDEVHPAFGVAEEELQQVIQNGIIHYAPQVEVRIQRCSISHSVSLRILVSIGNPPRWAAFRRTSPNKREDALGYRSSAR